MFVFKITSFFLNLISYITFSPWQNERLQRLGNDSQVGVFRCIPKIAEILASFQGYSIESRYCGILKPVRVLPCLVDNLIQAKESSTQIENRLQRVFTRAGPMNNELRKYHEEINASIPEAVSTVKESEDLMDGGLGIINSLYKRIHYKVEEIAEKGPKYCHLIRMENYYFIQKTLAPRGLPLLTPIITESKNEFMKVGMVMMG